MAKIARALARAGEWLRAVDPLAAASSAVALVILGNQPFYPLYVWWLVGDDGYASFLTFLSTPFFAAVPLLARRHSLASRALLPVVGAANTVFCAKVFGAASGVELFLAPCALIGAMSFHKSELRWAVATAALPIAAFFTLHGEYGAPLRAFSSMEYAAFRRMNAFSVACLFVFILYKFGRARWDAAK